MGKPPAVVIIARHGARLDQADKQWHLNNPLAYDTPLSYGGWTQARALGVRIGGILQAMSEEDHDGTTSSNANGSGSRKRKRKHKIIVHSSPFTRCIQTSIAISAGIRIGQSKARPSNTPKPPQMMHSGSPHLHAQEDSPLLSAIPEPPEPVEVSSLAPNSETFTALPNSSTASGARENGKSINIKQRVADLRLDAFLGEWLSPDYFENISAPPSSSTMVLNAKIQLLQPAEAIAGSAMSALGNFPGGWTIDFSTSNLVDESEEATGLANMAALGHSLPHRNRSRTHTGELSPAPQPRHRGPNIKLNAELVQDGCYIPPTPTYAISASSPIPVGYVAHARDACISFDGTWDSESPPQSWGNGGEYGEEWSRMHRRFRTGLTNMVRWYENEAKTRQAREAAQESSDDDEETVLILVTHGAGCNALIGALTNQPVLLDVGMASLTMAVRKKKFKETTSIDREEVPDSPSERRNGKKPNLDTSLADSYEVRLTASTEHLRGNVNNPVASPRIGPTGPTAHSYQPLARRPNATSSYGDSTFSIGDPGFLPTRPITSSGAVSPPRAIYSPVHRSSSIHSPLRGLGNWPANSAPKVSSGLWRSGTGTSVGSGNDGESGTDSDSFPNFGDVISKAKSPTSPQKPKRIDSLDHTEENAVFEVEKTNHADVDLEALTLTSDLKDDIAPFCPIPAASAPRADDPMTMKQTPPKPIRTFSQKGLWGSGASLALKETDFDVSGVTGRNGTPKRRWTSVDQRAA